VIAAQAIVGVAVGIVFAVILATNGGH